MKYFDTLISQKCTINTKKFWKVLEIWFKSPHVINRRILASTQLSIYKLKNVDSTNLFDWLINYKNELITGENIKENLSDFLQNIIKKNSCANICYDLEDIDYSQSEKNVIYLRFAKLLPRHVNKFSQTLELSVINVQDNNVIQFFYKNCDNAGKKSLGFHYPYQIKYENNQISILVQHLSQWKDNGHLLWLKNDFFCKFLKWLENEEQKNSLVKGSLKFVSLEKYTNLYNELKTKYGIKMVKIWPENTDPLKFVYEDVAIATYLLLLWEVERDKHKFDYKQSFLDLGCGNGLLVYILNSEGHPGFGIDLRKRKIWEFYPETTKLKVETIIPSSKSMFPEIDWLIGNHSDELTPWIPVIAARSSYKCRFFLLPCCAYEFNGKKYQRGNTASSQYSDYMRYIQEVSTKCGFKTDIDKLRIPSTKRICLIGTERNYLISESESYNLKIQEMINTRCNDNINNDLWSSDFKPRNTTEKVRNCTQIDKSLISNIIDIIISLLFRKVRMINFDDGTEKTWNAGDEIELSEIASAIDAETLKKLKNECGGLQTLLKNNGHIFKVEYGKVRLRVPGRDRIGHNKKSKNSNVTRKIKACWFYENHPDGCPQTDSECDFKH